MKKYPLAGLIGVVGLAGVAISVPVSAAEIVLKAGHSQNAGEPMDLGLQMIAEHLKEATGGRVLCENAVSGLAAAYPASSEI